MKIFPEFIFFCVCLVSLPIKLLAQSQGILTLDEAVNEAKQSSPTYLRSKALADEAGWKKLEAISVHVPHLAVNANRFFNVKYQEISTRIGASPVTFPAIYPSTLLSLEANWTVFDGLQGIHSFAAANLNASAAEHDLERAELQVEQEVKLQYYRALAAKLLTEVAEQNLKTLTDHFERTKELVHSGSATKFDLLRVQVQLEEATPSLAQAQDNDALARHALLIAVGKETDQGQALSGELPNPDQLKITENLKFDMTTRADLQAVTERSDAAGKAHLATIGNWIPRVTFMAQKQYYNNVDKSLESSAFKDAYALGVGFSWNLFDGGASIARERESVYHAQALEQTARQAVLRGPHEFDLWTRRLAFSKSLYHARSRGLEAAQESVRLAKLGFGAGTRTNTDVLDAELDLFRARAGLVDSQVQAVEAFLNIELALGKKL